MQVSQSAGLPLTVATADYWLSPILNYKTVEASGSRANASPRLQRLGTFREEIQFCLVVVICVFGGGLQFAVGFLDMVFRSFGMAA